MKTIKRVPVFFSVFVAFVLSGCTTPEPYLYGTTNVTVNSGAKSIEIADQVMVCYNAEWADPKTVLGLAAKECGKTKRKAHFVKHDFLACPVLVPARAYFSCVGNPMLPSQTSLIDSKRQQWPGTKSVKKIEDEEVPMADPELPPKLPTYLRK